MTVIASMLDIFDGMTPGTITRIGRFVGQNVIETWYPRLRSRLSPMILHGNSFTSLLLPYVSVLSSMQSCMGVSVPRSMSLLVVITVSFFIGLDLLIRVITSLNLIRIGRPMYPSDARSVAPGVSLPQSCSYSTADLLHMNLNNLIRLARVP